METQSAPPELDSYATFFKKQLHPGLMVAGLPLKNARFIHLLFAFPGGSSIEGCSEHGYAELVATLLARGAGPWDRSQFALECDNKGASLQVAAYYDLLVIELSILPEDLLWGLDLVAHMIYRPHFCQHEVVIAVREQCEQILARANEQKTALSDLSRASIFTSEHAYARPIAGSIKCLEEASNERIEAFYKRLLFGVAPTFLCAAGAFLEETLLSKLNKVFRQVKGARDVFHLLQEESKLFRAAPPCFSTLEFPTSQNRVLIGLPAIRRTHPRFIEYSLANEIFGGAFHSRLTRGIRAKEGLAYSASSHLWSGLYGGCLWISLQTEEVNLNRALRAVRVIMEDLLVDGLRLEEVEHFKLFLERSLTFEYDSLVGLTSRLLEHLLFGKAWRPQDRRQAIAKAAQIEALEDALKSILIAEQAVICVSGRLAKNTAGKSFFKRPTPKQMRVLSVPPLLGQAKAPPLKLQGVRPTLVATGEQAKLFSYPGGLHLLFLPRPEYLSISLQTWTCTGSMDDPKGRSGMAHLLEHLMFRGTVNVADGDFDSILAEKGGINNAFTSEDFTVYTDYVVQAGLADALALEADRFANLKVDRDVFLTEREVVLEERSLRVDSNPLGKAFEKLQQAAFPEHPYGWPVLGWREDVLNITQEELMACYKRAVQPEKLLVVIAGGCDEATATDLVGRSFAACLSSDRLPAKKLSWPMLANTRNVPAFGEQMLTFEDRSGYSYLLAAFRFPREGHPDYEAAELVSRIVGQGDSSYLYDFFVRRKQWAIEAWISYEPQARDHPLFHLGLATSDDFNFSLRQEELSSFLLQLPDQITEGDLEKARRGWRAEVAFATDELEDWATEVAARVLLLPWNEVWTQEDRIEAVELSDIKRVTATYLAPCRAIYAQLRATPGTLG